jgi:hypothetical protein
VHPGETAAEIDSAVGAGRRVIVIMIVRMLVIMGVSMLMPMIVVIVMMVMIMRMAVIVRMIMRMPMRVAVLMIMGMTLPRINARIPASAHRTHQSTSSSLTRSSSPAVTCN